MLHVKTPDEVLDIIRKNFTPLPDFSESVLLTDAIGRVLANDITAEEYVPDFNRSTVDGYAVRAADTFGCTDAIPAVLTLSGEILMGGSAGSPLKEGDCRAIPTGGAIPEGADCAVMIEYTEDYGDGTIGILKSAAPGQNMIFRGDDVFPGKKVLKAGRLLSSQDIGALAAMGIVHVPVKRKVRVGILSTGDELVSPDVCPREGQVRDVNAPMLAAMLKAFGAEPSLYGIIRDEETLLRKVVRQALEECDAVILSGGSSVGIRDTSCRIIEAEGDLLLHGIAMKPGKPTILGKTFSGKPVIGLPGHPVAASFVAKLFVLPLIAELEGRNFQKYTVPAILSENVGANHGRAQYGCVKLVRSEIGLTAVPIRSKSGLITSLAGADGYFCIGRDSEGAAKGETVQVTVISGD